MDFSICGIMGHFCGGNQTRYIEKRVSASLKGVKNEAFHVKNLAFKFFIFILCKIHTNLCAVQV